MTSLEVGAPGKAAPFITADPHKERLEIWTMEPGVVLEQPLSWMVAHC